MFRDRDELASSADLPSELREALAQSAHLIVVCSPAPAQSPWVNEEILEFKRLGRADRILPLIVDGEPHAATPERECFPMALSFQVDAAGRLTDQPAEPIAADLRPEADGKDNATLKLIAGLLGVPFNDLRQRELIAARRRPHIWQGIGAAMLLAMLATAGGWVAWRYAQHAEGLPAEGIRISADQVGAAAHVADQQGVSRRAIEDLLARAESAFAGLYRKTAEAPALPWREAAAPARLRGQYAVLLLVLADHHGVIGNTERQRATAEQARTLLTGVIAEEPSVPERREQLALSNNLIADAHAREWQVDSALAGYRAALAIRKAMAVRDPSNIRWQREIALSNISIGDMLHRQGQWGPALEAYRAAVGSLEQHAATAPAVQLERDLLIGRQRVGDMLLKQGREGCREGRSRRIWQEEEEGKAIQGSWTQLPHVGLRDPPNTRAGFTEIHREVLVSRTRRHSRRAILLLPVSNRATSGAFSNLVAVRMGGYASLRGVRCSFRGVCTASRGARLGSGAERGPRRPLIE